jgi:hypothetical protein
MAGSAVGVQRNAQLVKASECTIVHKQNAIPWVTAVIGCVQCRQARLDLVCLSPPTCILRHARTSARPSLSCPLKRAVYPAAPPLTHTSSSIHLLILRLSHTLHTLCNMRFSLASTLVVSLAAQATANSWFGKTGAYSEVSLSCILPPLRRSHATCQLISRSSVRQVARDGA